MSDTFLPKSELKDGKYYIGSCRNAKIAVWDADNQLFWYIRYKFGTYFPEEICHPEDDDGYDLFYPKKEGTPTDLQQVDLELIKKRHAQLLERRAAYKAEQEKK